MKKGPIFDLILDSLLHWFVKSYKLNYRNSSHLNRMKNNTHFNNKTHFQLNIYFNKTNTAPTRLYTDKYNGISSAVGL